LDTRDCAFVNARYTNFSAIVQTRDVVKFGIKTIRRIEQESHVADPEDPGSKSQKRHNDEHA
jgi:hypothetical protein